MPAARPVLGILSLSVLVAGCDVVAWQGRSHERALTSAGLVARQVSLGADTVRYWEGGSGPPVVLVHGFGADAIWQWDLQAAALASTHRLVVPDLLWFGGSSSSAPDYSIGHQVQMLVALADRLGIRRASWVGISYGGLVAYELARLHPEKVRRLVMVDSPGRGFTAADYEALLGRFSVSRIGDLLVPSTVEDVRRLNALAYHKPRWIPAFAARQALPLLTSYRQQKLALIEGLVAELRRPQPTTQPAAPTLIIWGREDPVFPVYLGERLRRAIRGARLEVIQAARHAPNLEHPEVFNQLLVPFLRE